MEELLGFGARVHTCSRNADEIDTCLRDWKSLGFEISGSVCDVSKRAQREQLMENVASLFDGKLNILVRFQIIPMITYTYIVYLMLYSFIL